MAKQSVRFFQLVDLLEQAGDTDECIDWPHSCDKDGYGWCSKSPEKRAHRVAFMHANNKTLQPGQQVLHRCDRPCCINPKHLWIGTVKDNMMDMAEKQRRALPCNIGEMHGRSKLSDKDIPVIRRLATEGLPAKEIALRFNVSRASISDVTRRVTWAHIA